MVRLTLLTAQSELIATSRERNLLRIACRVPVGISVMVLASLFPLQIALPVTTALQDHLLRLPLME